MIDCYGISDLVDRRRQQPSYHVVSERHVRIQFMNFSGGEKLGPIVYDGDVVLTCYGGEFELVQGDDSAVLGELFQAVIPAGERFSVACRSPAGTIQLIWAPPRARAQQEGGRLDGDPVIAGNHVER